MHLSTRQQQLETLRRLKAVCFGPADKENQARYPPSHRDS